MSNKDNKFLKDKCIRYAIWYEPTGVIYDELKTLIFDLAKKYDAPTFQPHITLLPGGSGLGRDDVVIKLQKIIKITEPFTTEFESYGYLDEYFKCLFVKVKQTKSIMSFAHRIQQEFNNKSNPEFTPHLSILYGKFPNEEKDKIIQSLDKVYRKSFKLKAVEVIEYELEKPPETWKKITSLRIGEPT